MTGQWIVWRQDGHGGRFEVTRTADRSEAEAVAGTLEARGHKQLYWVSEAPALAQRPPPNPVGALHHIELWVADLHAAERSWGWLLTRLGYRLTNQWPTGRTWTLGATYVVVESGPDVVPAGHERRRPGVNHLAFHAGTPEDVEAMAGESAQHGWRLLFADRHPHAGGPDHYAAYLENVDGFEVELVAAI